MRCLIDTNILIDVLSNRKNFVKESSSIMKFCETKIIDGYLSALSFADIVYILREKLDPEAIKKVLNNLVLIFTFTDLNSQDLLDAANLKWKDYEDALQSVNASKIKADYIITRNIKDYKDSKVKAITPIELLSKIKRLSN